MALQVGPAENTAKETAAESEEKQCARAPRPVEPAPTPPARGLDLVAMALLAAYVAYFAWQTRDYFVDDAYIGFQYIRNLLAGQGFVFHVGDPPVEGVTNIGWLLFLAPFAVLTDVTVAAKVLGLVLLLGSLLLTFSVGRNLGSAERQLGDCADFRATLRVPEMGLSPFRMPAAIFGLALAPLVLLASNFDFLYFSLAGMETSLLTVVLLLMPWIALRKPDSLWLPTFGAFAFLVHPEAVMAYPCYSVLLCTSTVNRRKLWLGNLVLAGLVGAATAIRFAYFHDVVPNTFHSKPSGLLETIIGGYRFLISRNVNVPFPITGWLALAVLVTGYVRLRRTDAAAAAMLAALTGTGLVFSVYCLPDWTGMARYFAAYLPATLILFWTGLVEAARRLVPEWSKTPTHRPVLAGVVSLLALIGLFDVKAKMAVMETFPGYVLATKNLVQPALWIRDHLPQGATIATRRIGALAYYGQRPVFDYTYGLPDRKVARLVAAAGHRFDTPTEPALAPEWRRRMPDYLLEDDETIDFIISKTGGTRERFSIHGFAYAVIKSFSIGRHSDWVLAGRLVCQ